MLALFIRGCIKILLATFVVGCSTSPPNFAQGLLSEQNDSTLFVFAGVDLLANMGKTKFEGTEMVRNGSGNETIPTYSISPSGDIYCIPPIPWVLASAFWNGRQPGFALGLNLMNWTSIAYIPTYSFLDKEWYSGYQFNQKVFRFAALSYTNYEEQMVAVLRNSAWGEIGPIKKMVLNEVALNLSIQFDVFGYPMVYSLVPKYTWSKNGEIDGAGFSNIFGFRINRPDFGKSK